MRFITVILFAKRFAMVVLLKLGTLRELALWERAPPAKGSEAPGGIPEAFMDPPSKLSGIPPAGFAGLSLASKLPQVA